MYMTIVSRLAWSQIVGCCPFAILLVHGSFDVFVGQRLVDVDCWVIGVMGVGRLRLGGIGYLVIFVNIHVVVSIVVVRFLFFDSNLFGNSNFIVWFGCVLNFVVLFC